MAGDSLYDQAVAEEQIQCRVYAPVGQHEDLLAYLVRRLLKNGANSSFVNAIVDPKLPVESLLIDPLSAQQDSLRLPIRKFLSPHNYFQTGLIQRDWIFLTIRVSHHWFKR